MDKLKRIIAANDLDVTKTKYIETINRNGKNIIIVECDDVKYELDGNTKTEIKKIETDEWKPIAGIHNGSITYTEEYLEKIKTFNKPRGWHFRPVFVDEENNVYFKGELQQDLRGKYDKDGNLLEE